MKSIKFILFFISLVLQFPQAASAKDYLPTLNQCLNDVLPPLKAPYKRAGIHEITLYKNPPNSPYLYVLYQREGKTYVDMFLLSFRAEDRPSCLVSLFRSAELLLKEEWLAQASGSKNFAAGTCPANASLLDLSKQPNVQMIERTDTPQTQNMGMMLSKQVFSVTRDGVGPFKLSESTLNNNLCVVTTEAVGTLINTDEPVTGECDTGKPDGNNPCRLKSLGPPPAQPRVFAPGAAPAVPFMRPAT